MKHQYVIGHYNGDGSNTYYARNEEYKRVKLKVLGFRPYFYVRSKIIPDHPKINEITDFDFEAVFGGKVRRLTMEDPTDVGGKDGKGGFREEFDEHLEADIRFIRRQLIDMKIRSGFEAPDNQRVVNYKELEHCDFSLSPLKSFFDIETYTGGRMPSLSNPSHKITAATFWDDINQKYATLLLDDSSFKQDMNKEWVVYHIEKERNLLLAMRKYLSTVMPDIASEWSMFDYEYLIARALKYHRMNFRVFKGICVFDMWRAYRKLYKKGSNRLKDVALEEGVTDIIEQEVNYAQMYDEERMKLAERNMRHVKWMVELDKAKRGMLDFYWSLKNTAGLESLADTLFHGVLVDTMLLRNYHGKYVLPSKPSTVPQREEKAGGIVGEAPKGLIKDIAIYDFSRYYPNLMIGLLMARKEKNLEPIIELCQQLLDEREKYEKILLKLKPGSPEHDSYKNIRDSVKFIGEAVIGFFGSEKSRLYNKAIFESVTHTGQKGILYLKKTAKDFGYDTHYYDTDGIFIQVPERDAVFALMDELNKSMVDFSREIGIDRDITLKVDRIADMSIFTGVKKRYAMHVVWEDGKDVDYLHVKGFEQIRRDASLVTRRAQRKVFNAILRGKPNGLVEYLKEEVKMMKNGSYSLRDVAIPKTLNKALKSYKSKVDYLRGALYANKYFGTEIKGGDQVRMLFVKRVPGFPSTDVVCFQDEEDLPDGIIINWERLIERTLRGKVENFLLMAGMSWDLVQGTRRLTDVFG